jgi:hypothetical protein
MTKQAAAQALHGRAAMGRELLTRPIATEADLEALTSLRTEWSLANKKLVSEVLGDAAGQVRFAHAQAERSVLRPTHEDRVREFQTLMIGQIADLERLAVVLSKIG